MARWGVEPLKWPAHSPDLSPVEQMWNIVRLAAFDRVYKSFEEFAAALRKISIFRSIFKIK